MGASSHSSSSLAQTLSSKNLATSFMAFNTSYTDTGLFGLYAVTENFDKADDLVRGIQEEWKRLSSGVSESEVARAKNQLKTSLLLSLDGTTPVCEDIGRQVLTFGKRLTPWEIDALIEGVGVDDVVRVARGYLRGRDVSVVGYGPVEGVPGYESIRGAMV